MSNNKKLLDDQNPIKGKEWESDSISYKGGKYSNALIIIILIIAFTIAIAFCAPNLFSRINLPF